MYLIRPHRGRQQGRSQVLRCAQSGSDLAGGVGPVALALAAGATRQEVVATLEALAQVLGAVRVVSSAPKVALALGYDVEAALE
jgi:hypothetical protein